MQDALKNSYLECASAHDVEWPPRLLELALDYFPWDLSKVSFYPPNETPQSFEDIVARLHAAFTTVDVHILRRVQDYSIGHVERCIAIRGEHFEHLLWSNGVFIIISLLMEFTLHLVQVHYTLLVLVLREHLSYINHRLDSSIIKWEDVAAMAEHRRRIVGISQLTLYLVQLQFIFLVLMIREHLTYINQRLDGCITKWEEVVLLSEHRAGIVYVANLVHFTFLVLMMIREHLVYINHRLDGSVIKWVEVDILAEHRGGIVGVVRLVNATYSVQANDTALKVHAIIRRTNEASLKNKIVAALTTYLIILIQFQLSDQPAKEYQQERNVIHCLNLLNQTNSSYAVN
uniref:Gustatory receptor n=1 Tax=Timema bartmani TaxID=61472 RepID=A0A7R9I5Q0_9NEOP|nr:unnamed protein product [Timema bartmani]